MAGMVDVFLPSRFLIECFTGYLLGYYRTINLHTVLIVSLISSNIEKEKDIICAAFNDTQRTTKCKFGVIGFVRNVRGRVEYFNPSVVNETFIHLHIDFDLRNIFIASLTVCGNNISPKFGKVVIYNDTNFANSQFLISETQLEEDLLKDSFIELLCSCANYTNSKWDTLEQIVLFTCPVGVNETDMFGSFLRNIYSYGHLVCLCMLYVTSSAKEWCPSLLISYSSIGRHLHQRLLQFETVLLDITVKHTLSLCAKNIILAVLLDVLCGVGVCYTLQQITSPSELLYHIMIGTNDIVSWLQRLIYWLMGFPAGLKLNIPVNYLLGSFFLWHIHLWKSYIAIIQPLFAIILQTLMGIGVVGVTFIPCLLNDLMSLAMVHIYIFYGYASRIYYYQLRILSTLWKVFRGKKWNPELHRVESYKYTIYQLYTGTLLFTILLFLLPTVMVYYFVFTALRVMVLAVQGLISRLTNILSVFPLYVIVLRLLNSSTTTGDVYFTVLKTNPTLVLSLELVQVPLSTVVKGTLPKMPNYSNPLSWRALVSSLVWGKIIYPI